MRPELLRRAPAKSRYSYGSRGPDLFRLRQSSFRRWHRGDRATRRQRVQFGQESAIVSPVLLDAHWYRRIVGAERDDDERGALGGKRLLEDRAEMASGGGAA